MTEVDAVEVTDSGNTAAMLRIQIVQTTDEIHGDEQAREKPLVYAIPKKSTAMRCLFA